VQLILRVELVMGEIDGRLDCPRASEDGGDGFNEYLEI
jgi:hypothetical protein